MAKSAIKTATVIPVPAMKTGAAAALPKGVSQPKPPKASLSALFGGKRPRQAVASVPTRTQAL